MDKLTHILEQEAEPEYQAYYAAFDAGIPHYGELQFEWDIPVDHVLDYLDTAHLNEDAENWAMRAFEKTGHTGGDMQTEFHGQTITGRWSID